MLNVSNSERSELNQGQNTVNELIKKCKNSIVGEREIAGYHCGPVTPILFVALGSNSCHVDQMEIVKETIELAWNNIQGNLIVLEYPEKLSRETLIAEIDENVAKLRETEGIFLQYNTSKVFFFIDCEDDLFNEYVSILESDLRNNNVQLQLLVVAKLNERTEERKALSRERLSLLAKLKARGKIQGLLALSNALYSGQIVGDSAESNHYRIASNIAYLSNSYEMSNGLENPISREICDDLLRDNTVSTVSYIHLSKPSTVIARTTLKTILDVHEKNEKEKITSGDFDNSIHGFRKKMVEDKKGGIFGLDKFFEQEILPLFPKDIEISDFPYFCGVEKITSCASPDEFEQIMNDGSLGVWSLCAEYNFIKVVEHYIENYSEKITETIKNFIKRNFSYREIFAYLDSITTKDDIEKEFGELRTKVQLEFNPNNIKGCIYELFVSKARDVFFKNVNKYCKKAFDEYRKEVTEFNKIINTIGRLLSIGYSPNDPVAVYYKDLVTRLYEQNGYERNIDELNTPCKTIEEYCERVEKVYNRFIDTYPNDFKTSFEDELSKRINEIDTTTSILNDLGFQNEKMVEACHLSYGRRPSGNTYCIAYADAKFMNRLKDNQDIMGKIFETSRQECAERIMLCPFSCDDAIIGGSEE